MKLGIIGSRDFNDFSLLENTIKQNYKIENINTIISGGELGADTLAETFSTCYNIPITIYRPNWILYGNKAEYIRNRLMVVESDELIAFWNGSSQGTKTKIDYANSIGKKIIVVNIMSNPSFV